MDLKRLRPWIICTLIAIVLLVVNQFTAHKRTSKQTAAAVAVTRAAIIDSIRQVAAQEKISELQAEQAIFREQMDSLLNQNQRLENENKSLLNRISDINRTLGKRPRF